MAMTHFLLQSNFNFHLHPFSSTKWSSSPNNIIPLKRNHSHYYCIKTSPKSNIKCIIMNPKPQQYHNLKKVCDETVIKFKGVIWRSMENVMKTIQISVITSALMFFYGHSQAAVALASSSEVYSTHTSSQAPMVAANVVESSTYEFVLLPSIALVSSYLIIRWLDYLSHSEVRSVLKLQVGLSGAYTSVRRDLKRIVGTNKPMSNVLQESVLSPLRHSNYCISGYSSLDVKRRPGEGERQFNHLSIEEMIKFGVVNAHNNREKSATSQSSNNEYIVVTILVVVCDLWRLPPVTSSEQLKKALRNLGSIPPNCIQNVEVLWNPQHENDALTEQELLEDYPLLLPI